MSSNTLLFDLLCDEKEFKLWATYHNWQGSKVHQGFRLACVYQGHFFNWDSWELRRACHPDYYKVLPQVAQLDDDARDKAIDFLENHVNYDDLLDRAQMAQSKWNQVEDALHVGKALQALVDADRATNAQDPQKVKRMRK